MSEELGTFIILWEEDGDETTLVASDETQLDTAVDQWLREERDTMLHLTTLTGETYRVPASLVKKWVVSTPQGRLRSLELEQLHEAERKQHRNALGLPWEDS